MLILRLAITVVLLSSLNVIECGTWNEKISGILTGIKKADEVVTEIFNVVSHFNGIVAEISQAIQLFNDLGQPTLDDQIKKQHDEVMEKLSHVSNQIDDLSLSVSQGFMIAIKEIITNMENIDDFTQSTHELSSALETVNIYYEMSVKLRKSYEMAVNKRTLEDFVDHIFKQSNDIPYLLAKIHSILFKPVSLVISKNFFDIFKIYYMKNYKNRCNINMSPHQRLYYIYLSIITTEIKGMIAIAHGYSIRTLLREGSFKNELMDMKNSTITRIKKYLSGTKSALKNVERDIRQCDAPAPIRDVTFVELEKLSHLYVSDESTLTTSYCDKTCDYYKLIDYDQMVLENGFYLGGPMKICSPGTGSSREYSWLKKSDKDYYGRYTKCSGGEKTVDSHPVEYFFLPGFEWMTIFYTHPTCDICGLSYYGEHKISIHAQYSDIQENMIVTGVKFVRVNETLYIKIQQGKLLVRGMVENGPWVDLKSKNNSDRFIKYHRRTLYLDNVVVAPNYVVTGISFRLNVKKDGYKIVVRGTLYDFATGQLNVSQTKWFDPEDSQPYAEGYYGNRTEIPLSNLDNPIFAKFNEPDRYTNKLIKFTHTSLEKDAGQTTIPLLDAQPIRMNPATALNGIGMYYRGAKGFGGYVALRIFTDSMEEYLDIWST